MVEEAYNPLDKKRLAESVAKAMLERPAGPLPPAESFLGVGVYAIYYLGDFKAYAAISARNRDGKFELPIYVGRAMPAGRRKGGLGLEPTSTRALYNRLKEHAKSIERAKNLSLPDFACRWLVVDAVWIPLAESMLIEWFTPLWNSSMLDGFGLHDPSKTRYEQQCSAWDWIHPGRKWAERMQPNRRSREEILAGVEEFLASHT